MSAPPPTSVLLPVRDGAAYLPDAIRSLEEQTDPDYEAIVVDDGSLDESPDVLADWAARDARVRALRQPAAGIVAALERARSVARGRYLARMDADDVALAGRFRAQRSLLEEDPSLAGCGCRVRYVPRSSVRAGARRYEAWLNASLTPAEVEREIFVECPLAHPTFFLRADAVEAAGGYRDREWPEDYDLVLRLWSRGERLAKVPESLLLWRERPDRLSRTHPRYAPEAFRRVKVEVLTRTLLRARRGAVLWGAGRVGKAFARALLGAGAIVRAFAEVDPRKLGQEIHGAPVLDAHGALALRGALHLAAVGQPGRRDELRAILSAAGLKEMEDFVAVA